MPTSVDNAIASKSKGMLIAFTVLVCAGVAFVQGGGKILPEEKLPEGDPRDWTREELRRWLEAKKMYPGENDTREQLLERVLLYVKQ